MCKINYVSMQPNIESNEERKKLNLPNFNEYSQTIPANLWILSYKFLPKKKRPSIDPDRYLRECRKNEEKIKIYLRMVFTSSGI